MNNSKTYTVYKGLQKPLVFQNFKGKFIYWGIGSILAGLISCMAFYSFFGIGYALLILVVIMGGGLIYTSIKQKRGLHSKKIEKGIYCITLNKYHL